MTSVLIAAYFMKRILWLLIIGPPAALAIGWLWNQDRWPSLHPTQPRVDEIATTPVPGPGMPRSTVPPANIAPVQPDPDALSQFKGHLGSGRYDQAMEQYLAIYRGSDAQRTEAWRQTVLQTALQLLQNKRYETAHQLLSSYLAFFYKDVSALSLAASAQHGLARHGSEVELLFQAHHHAHRNKDRRVLRQRLDQAIKEQGQWLARERGNAGAIAFYQTLVQRDPIEPSYRIALAQLYLKKRDPRRALENLDTLDKVYAGDQQNSIVALRDRARSMITQEQARQRVIPLLAQGQASAVRAVINGSHTVTLLIDTGASLVTLRPEVARRIGLPTTRTNVLFHTANGSVRAPIVRIRELKVGGHAVSGLSAGVLPLSNTRYDGLLGMNYLKRFRFQIDQQRRVLLLNERN